jgi:hypothetical protein
MSEPKHTRGPWVVHESGGDIRIEGDHGECVARAYMAHDFPQIDNAEDAAEANVEGRANAILIAAAPDLLAAAHRALAIHEDAACSCRGCADLRVAIAMAEGK